MARRGRVSVKRHAGLNPNPRDGVKCQEIEKRNFDFLPILKSGKGGPPKGFEIILKKTMTT